MQNRGIIDQTRPDQTRPDHPIARNSSLELLRIVAMFMIVAFHLSYKSGFDFNGESLLINRLWIKFCGMGESLGYVGNNIFVLISGFFLVKSARVNWRHLLNLWARVLFYSVALFTLHAIYKWDFRLGGAIRAIFPISTQAWWFISHYAAIYLIHPALNDILHALPEYTCRKFIALLMVVWGIIILANANVRMWHLMDFLILYFAGGYIRLWSEKSGRRSYIVYGLGLMLMNFALRCCFVEGSINTHGFIFRQIYPSRYINAMSGVLNFSAAVLVLLGFLRLEIPHSRMINVIASAVTGVYLLHDHGLTAKLWWHKIFLAASFQHSPYLIPYTIAAVLTVYTACTIIELARSKIFKVLSHGNLS